MVHSVYDQQILRILTEVGERGIRVHLLAKHLYNLNCGLFSTVSIEDIRLYVRQYLLRNSKSSQSLIERNAYGCYRLNTARNQTAQQLILQFSDEQQGDDGADTGKEEQAIDLSLDLFAGEED